MLLSGAGQGGKFMDLQTRILGALIVTYFVSRLTLRLPVSLTQSWGILLCHAIALVVIAAGVSILQSVAGAFSLEHLMVYLSPQVLWCLLDLLREHPVGLSRNGGGSRHKLP